MTDHTSKRENQGMASFDLSAWPSLKISLVPVHSKPLEHVEIVCYIGFSRASGDRTSANRAGKDWSNSQLYLGGRNKTDAAS